MLQTVRRPSIDISSNTLPRYSMTWPVPPAVPITPMMWRITSLGVTPAQRPFDPHFQRLRPLEQQRLRRQHMLDLGGADAEGQRADAAVAGGVAVAAHDGRAGQRKALFGADDMDDALFAVGRVDVADAEFGRVACAAPRVAARFRGRRWAVRCPRCRAAPWSAGCDRARRASGPAGAPCGLPRAALRTPAGWSLRGRGDGRYRSGRCRRRCVSTTWASQIFS
jgi:hypothetical protein